MIEDRDYMRQPEYRSGMSLTKLLTIVLVAIYALQCINDVYLKTPAESWLALTREGFTHGWVWQLFTFQLLHFNLMHVVFNLIAFWWLGHFLEPVLGRKRFLIALFGCGAVGGVLQGTLMWLFPPHYGFQTVGASAGVSGLLAIFALLERNSEIRFQFLFPMRAIILLWISGGISLFFTLVPTPREMAIAHAAHLGGLLAGIAWVKLGWHRDFIQLPWEGWFNRSKDLRPVSRERRAAPGKGSRVLEQAGEPPSAEEIVGKKVDAILDKISASGIKSLTAEERATLEAARKKMTKP
jgi:membrane associated rhomboid family serine protease